MNDLSIAFIGGGNMAGSLIGGLADGHPPERLAVADTDAGRRGQMAARFGIRAFAVNAEAAATADVVVIAVKPQVVEAVARDLPPP